jgi:hypothetical protein
LNAERFLGVELGKKKPRGNDEVNCEHTLEACFFSIRMLDELKKKKVTVIITQVDRWEYFQYCGVVALGADGVRVFFFSYGALMTEKFSSSKGVAE